MRRLHPEGTYRVEIYSSAWKALGRVPLESFRKVTAILDAMAEKEQFEGKEIPSPREGVTRYWHRYNGHAAIYEVDHERKAVVLIDIEKAEHDQ